ncbi:hypothetical protein MPTK1_3g01895 [Marchantia polymorpha subsp. ruderalis]
MRGWRNCGSHKAEEFCQWSDGFQGKCRRWQRRGTSRGAREDHRGRRYRWNRDLDPIAIRTGSGRRRVTAWKKLLLNLPARRHGVQGGWTLHGL